MVPSDTLCETMGLDKCVCIYGAFTLSKDCAQSCCVYISVYIRNGERGNQLNGRIEKRKGHSGKGCVSVCGKKKAHVYSKENKFKMRTAHQKFINLHMAKFYPLCSLSLSLSYISCTLIAFEWKKYPGV